MKKKSFRQLDSLDKFLTIYLKLLDNSIESCTDDMFRDIYTKDKNLVMSVVDIVRFIDNLSDEDLKRQLKVFDQDPDLKTFISQLVLPYDYNRELKDNTTKHFGQLKETKTELKKEDIKYVKDKN